MKALKPLKPFMLRRWRIGQRPNCRYLFTCARPGRTGDLASKRRPVSDDVVHRWVHGLPGPETALVSLLGRKPDGTSEFSFYSFYGGFDVASDHPTRFSFQEWLDRWHAELVIVLKEHPTYDFKPITPETLDAIAADIDALLSADRTVVLVDSGGRTRTGIVCQKIGAIEDSSTLAW
jgi:hypothetical protein